MKRNKILAVLLGSILAAVAAVGLFRVLAPSPGKAETVTISGEGKVEDFTYRRPVKGDGDYKDYKEMLDDPYYARFVHGGGKPPFYDPEWRAPIEGKRQVPVNDLSLEGGAVSLDELGTFLLMAIAEDDGDAIDRLRITRDEFEVLCWPEFPQSRPYLRIPADEAWTLHFANMRKGARKALHQLRGQTFTLAGLTSGSTREYTNFRVFEDLTLRVEDAHGRRQDLPILTSVIECRGKYKVFMFNEHFNDEGGES